MNWNNRVEAGDARQTERQGTGTHNKMLFIQRGDGAARADLLRHERLGKRRLVKPEVVAVLEGDVDGALNVYRTTLSSECTVFAGDCTNATTTEHSKGGSFIQMLICDVSNINHLFSVQDLLRLSRSVRRNILGSLC